MKKSFKAFLSRRYGIGSLLLLSLLGVGLVNSLGREMLAAEPAREFLNGLRERGYHDIALDYLKMMETSSLAPAELKEIIQFHLPYWCHSNATEPHLKTANTSEQ